MGENKKIPGFNSYEEMGEFWDTHDLADYWEQTEPAEFEILPDAHRRYSEEYQFCKLRGIKKKYQAKEEYEEFLK